MSWVSRDVSRVTHMQVNLNEGAQRRNVVLRENGEFWVFGEKMGSFVHAQFESGDTIRIEVCLCLFVCVSVCQALITVALPSTIYESYHTKAGQCDFCFKVFQEDVRFFIFFQLDLCFNMIHVSIGFMF